MIVSQKYSKNLWQNSHFGTSLRGGPNHADRFEEVRQELDIIPV